MQLVLAQAFNPSWIVAGSKQPHTGLLVRTQNCTGCGSTYDPTKDPKAGCCHCSGTGEAASIITFAKLIGGDDSNITAPKFERLTADSVVFGPHDDSDLRGTEGRIKIPIKIPINIPIRFFVIIASNCTIKL